MNRPMTRLMVMAGGTGGHVFPALVVANALREKRTRITWLGTRRGLEATVVKDNGFEIEWVSVEGLRGKGLLSWLLAPFKLLRAMWQSASAIRKTKPDCILGMGGFVAGPGGLVARLMGKPLIIHEQNAVAGLTNQYLAKIASRVLTGFPAVEGLPADASWVGNPVRDVIKAGRARSKIDIVNVLIIGGSQGALSFNRNLPKLLSNSESLINIWHQCGRDRAVGVDEAYRALNIDAKVSEFIDDMASAYQWADLLVCRAGAMTIAECAAAGKPALLIPYPYSAGDHQLKNAQAMVDVGAGIIVSDQQLCQANSLPELDLLLADKHKLLTMANNARALHKPDALDSVVRACEEYLNA